MHIKDLIEQLILEELDKLAPDNIAKNLKTPMNEETEVRIPETISDFQSDIVKSERSEMAEKLKDDDYYEKAKKFSEDLKSLSQEIKDNGKLRLAKYTLSELIATFGDTMFFLHEKDGPASRDQLEDPIDYWANHILLDNDFEENKDLIQKIDNEAGSDVADAFANAVLKKVDDLKPGDATDDMYDLYQWIGDPSYDPNTPPPVDG